MYILIMYVYKCLFSNILCILSGLAPTCRLMIAPAAIKELGATSYFCFLWLFFRNRLLKFATQVCSSFIAGSSLRPHRPPFNFKNSVLVEATNEAIGRVLRVQGLLRCFITRLQTPDRVHLTSFPFIILSSGYWLSLYLRPC
jgi:hypothetical protein